MASNLIDQLENRIQAHIPLAKFMCLNVDTRTGNTLTMKAPLAPNINDKGCAFGGSLASCMTLCGWGLVNLLLADANHSGDIFVAQSDIKYIHPVWEDFYITATLEPGQSTQSWQSWLERRGKARFLIESYIHTATSNTPLATLKAKYVAISYPHTTNNTSP